MKENKEKFFAFLEEQKENTMKEVQRLIGDERKDESNTLKAKANIYDIFEAIWNASEQMADSDDSFRKIFMQKAEMIPGQWRASLENAKAHNDTRKIMIEESKLEAVDEIMKCFDELS